MRKYRHICRISIQHICCNVSIYWTYYVTDGFAIFTWIFFSMSMYSGTYHLFSRFCQRSYFYIIIAPWTFANIFLLLCTLVIHKQKEETRTNISPINISLSYFTYSLDRELLWILKGKIARNALRRNLLPRFQFLNYILKRVNHKTWISKCKSRSTFKWQIASETIAFID